MPKLTRVAVALMTALLATLLANAIPRAAQLGTSDASPVEFSTTSAIIDLKDHLAPYHAPSGTESDGSRWYMITAVNNSVRPSTRVFLAGQPVDAPLRVWPLPARPAILQVAASDSQVIVEDARAHARHAFRVTIPPATTATLAIRIAYGDQPPSVLAWTEPALVSHNRQLAVFVAAVIGMIAAAMAITMGLAVMTAHPAPFWASGLLVMIFILRLAVTGTLDSGWATHIGGPFGLEIALAGLALTVGLQLADVIVPLEARWPGRRKYFERGLLGLAFLSLLSFLGVPGAMILTDIAILAGTTGVTLYFAYRGRRGDPAARVALPSAAVFALVAWGTALVAFGGIQDNQAAPAIVEGMTQLHRGGSAGACCRGRRGHRAALPASRYGTVRQTDRGAQANGGTETNPDLLAIAASHQGVFDDHRLRNGILRLSGEAAC